MANFPRVPGHTLIGKIGQGAWSTVYSGISSNGLKRAIKILDTEALESALTPARAQQHFLSELQVLSSLSHPNIISLCDFGRTLGTNKDYLVMELVEGDQFVKATRALSTSYFYMLIRQLSAALHYLHTRGYVHGDLKPENIMVVSSPTEPQGPPHLKLIDLGYAFARETPRPSELTGTPRYLAPEVIRGSGPTVASDLFSMGAILHECLTGSPPYNGEAAGVALQRQLVTPPSIAEPTEPTPVHSLTHHLLASDPQKRPASAAEILRTLDAHISPHAAKNGAAYDIGAFVRSGARAGDVHSRLLRDIEHHQQGERANSPLALLVTGEPGSGKSTLLRDLSVQCRTMGHIVPRGPCTITALHGFEEFLLSIVPRESIHPILIAIDDATESAFRDVASQPLLIALSRIPNLILLVAVRSTPTAQPDLEALTAMFAHTGFVCVTQVISPWDRPTARTYLTGSVRGLNVDEDLIDALCAHTGGCQLLFIDTVLSGLEQGIIVATMGRLRLLGSLDDVRASDQVTAILSASIASLSPSANRTFTALSAAGGPLSLQDLSELCDRRDDDLISDCRQLLSAGLVRCSGNAPAKYNAPSALARALAMSALQRRDRVALHTRIAQWYSTMSDLVSLGHAAEHFIASDDKANALAYCMKAASRLLDAGNHHRAIHFLTRALQQDPDSAVRLQLTVECASALTMIGRLEEAWRRLIEAEPLVPTFGHERAAYIYARARCLYAMGHLGDSATWARRAHGAAPVSSHPFIHIGALIVRGKVHAKMQRYAHAKRTLVRANALARRHRCRSHIGDSLSELSFVYWQQGQYSRALLYSRRSHLLGPIDGRPVDESGPLTNIGVLHMELGHSRKARNAFRKAVECSTHLGRSIALGAAHNNLAEVSRRQGRWMDAARGYATAIAATEGSGIQGLSAIARSNGARILAHTGNFIEAIELLKHSLRNPALSSIEVRGSVLPSWLLLLLTIGRVQAATRFGRFAERQISSSGGYALKLELRCLMALARHEAGEQSDTDDENYALPHAESTGCSFDVGLLRDIARIAISNPLLETSTPTGGCSLRNIIATARNKGMRWHLTWALVLLGERLLRDNKPAEAEAALTEAAKIARKNADKPLFWQANYWLGRLYEQKLQYETAYRKYRFAALTIHEMALGLDEEKWRRPFLEQAKVRDVLDRFERLRGEVAKKVRYDMATVSRSERVSRRMLGALSAIGQKLTSILDLNELLRELLDLSIENVRAERGIVFLADEAAGAMRPAIARGMDKESLDGITSFSRSVIDQVAKGQTLLTIDVGQDASLAANKSLILHEIKSILAVPMRHRGKTVGIIYLDTRKGPQLFTDKERAFVESFASQAAIAIENARLFGQMNTENTRLRREAEGRARFENLIGASPAMKKLTEVVAGVLDSDCNVLVLGESGTGKELVARAIHYNGPRKKKKFVAVDCGALPENLLEAELFGYARGAFTGADRDRVGLIEEARGGTLFLDEITNTSLALQSKLLRVLQEREVRRLGENAPRPVDVRVIAATNGDIKTLMEQGKFRQDLYYRLNVVSIEVPPLRSRREDIPLLAEHFLRERAGQGVAPKRLGPAVSEALLGHDWPGNVRELANVIERAHVLSPGDVITAQDLPEGLRAVAPRAGPSEGHDGETRKSGEQLMIEEALRRFGGDKAKTARYIGWNRQKLYRRMKEFGIPADYGRTDQAA